MCKKSAGNNPLNGNEEKEGLFWQEEVAMLRETMMEIFFFAPPQPSSFFPCLLCSPVYHFLLLFPSLLSCYLYCLYRQKLRNRNTELLCSISFWKALFTVEIQFGNHWTQQATIANSFMLWFCFDFKIQENPERETENLPFTIDA